MNDDNAHAKHTEYAGSNGRNPISIFYSKQLSSSGVIVKDCSAFAVNGMKNGDFVSIDWNAFADWLENKGLRKKHRADMLSYAKRYVSVLFTGRLSMLEGIAGKKHALMSLSNLCKFLGFYSRWRQMMEESGLKWGSARNSLDIFQKIYENETEGIEQWVDQIVEIGDEELSFSVVFMALTGLRTGEAIMCLERIAKKGLHGYLKDGLLEHFRYPEQFLRRTKNAYVSILPDRLLSVLEKWDKHVSYSMLSKRCKKYELPIRFYDLRKLHASTLRMNGIPSEIVDLLQGRVGSSIFVASYLRPDFKKIIGKVKQILKPYGEKWLS